MILREMIANKQKAEAPKIVWSEHALQVGKSLEIPADPLEIVWLAKCCSPVEHPANFQRRQYYYDVINTITMGKNALLVMEASFLRPRWFRRCFPPIREACSAKERSIRRLSGTQNRALNCEQGSDFWQTMTGAQMESEERDPPSTWARNAVICSAQMIRKKKRETYEWASRKNAEQNLDPTTIFFGDFDCRKQAKRDKNEQKIRWVPRI
ncbi:hypothetical protein C8R45DRAFT_946508 [Mycena sanguinolenta]|nr:hypothetical protein C8R45DRAFT_946508 [Mycena sanguinolenta]